MHSVLHTNIYKASFIVYLSYAILILDAQIHSKDAGQNGLLSHVHGTGSVVSACVIVLCAALCMIRFVCSCCDNVVHGSAGRI